MYQYIGLRKIEIEWPPCTLRDALLTGLKWFWLGELLKAVTHFFPLPNSSTASEVRIQTLYRGLLKSIRIFNALAKGSVAAAEEGEAKVAWK